MYRIAATAVMLAIAAFVSAAEGQTAPAHRIGFLSTSSASAATPRVEAFRQGLRDLGYIEGRNVAIEYRWAEGKEERLHALAADLVSLGVDIIVTQGTVPTLAARKATARIPIVMATAGDPVATGLVATLARPGGNITGLTQINPEISGKRLELLQQLLPQLTRVAVLWNTGNPVAGPEVKTTEAAARSLRLTIHTFGVEGPDGLQGAFSAMKRERPGALIILSDIMFFGQRRHIAEFAVQARLPTIAWTRELAESGVLMTYGPNTVDMHRRAALYVDKILKGARPPDLPIEQPIEFELMINLKTAKALGVTIPPSLLQRADQVIE